MHLSNKESSSVGIHQRGRLLEQAEHFEDDHNNDNYSDYIEDASVHAGANTKLSVRWPAFIQIERAAGQKYPAWYICIWNQTPSVYQN
jgi:hypothetical protein